MGNAKSAMRNKPSFRTQRAFVHERAWGHLNRQGIRVIRIITQHLLWYHVTCNRAAHPNPPHPHPHVMQSQVNLSPVMLPHVEAAKSE
jgi:hypothetical protein